MNSAEYSDIVTILQRWLQINPCRSFQKCAVSYWVHLHSQINRLKANMQPLP